MKNRSVSILAPSVLALSTGPVWAGPIGIQRNWPPNEQAAAVAALEAKRDQVGQQMPEPPKGPELARCVTGLDRLNELINRIQSGQPVSPENRSTTASAERLMRISALGQRYSRDTTAPSPLIGGRLPSEQRGAGACPSSGIA